MINTTLTRILHIKKRSGHHCDPYPALLRLFLLLAIRFFVWVRHLGLNQLAAGGRHPLARLLHDDAARWRS